MSEFLAGAASESITPSTEIIEGSLRQSASYIDFDQPPGSPLQVKCLVVTQGHVSIMLVALDLVGVIASHCEAIRQEIARAIPDDTCRIIISASHSHSAPFPEPVSGPHPYLSLICERAAEAAKSAWDNRRPARFGHGSTSAVGHAFNQRVPMPDGGVKFTRDFREGLATGRPVDPRLNVIRIDDLDGRPIAGWVRVAAHPACVIFNGALSAEYPGYMTDSLSRTVADGAPVLFGYGASGDVNCVPMFGSEEDSRNLGVRLAEWIAPVFANIKTAAPRSVGFGRTDIDLPLEQVPSVESLDKDISEVEAFVASLDDDPSGEWVLGINCKKEWPVEKKKAHVAPLAEWARRVKQAIQSGTSFPTTWRSTANAVVIDDIGLLFYSGEPFTTLSLEVAAKSPLSDTLLMAFGNGCEGYIGLDDDWKRGGYEPYTSNRYSLLADGMRPLPYTPDAGECLAERLLELIQSLGLRTKWGELRPSLDSPDSLEER
jgi:neutral ceramidase